MRCITLLIALCTSLPAVAAAESKGALPGKEVTYGDGTVYRREVLFGSFAAGNLDGPPEEMELYGGSSVRAPNGDWYILEEDVTCGLYKYDAKKKRVIALSSGCPYGKQGGTIETMRLARGGYARTMSLQVDPSGKALKIYDRNNGGIWWQVNLETGVVTPAEGADNIADTTVRGSTSDGSLYFAKNDGKLKKLLPDGKSIQDLGVTLESPLHISTFDGRLVVSEGTNRLYAMSRDPHGPWGIVWYWDMKTGKATRVAGAQKGEKPDDTFRLASGPAEKVSFWCASGISLGPDRGERYVYLGGGDETTISRIDLAKKYVTKLIRPNRKNGDLWSFGEGRYQKDYGFLDPYNWPGTPTWGAEGEFYMSWPLCTKIEVYRPVGETK